MSIPSKIWLSIVVERKLDLALGPVGLGNSMVDLSAST